MKMIVILALAASLSACATPRRPVPSDPVTVPVDQHPHQQEY